MVDAVEAQASLEGVLKDEIIRMYEEVAENPEAEFHFFHGREAAELFGYDRELLDRAPAADPLPSPRSAMSRCPDPSPSHREWRGAVRARPSAGTDSAG